MQWQCIYVATNTCKDGIRKGYADVITVEELNSLYFENERVLIHIASSTEEKNLESDFEELDSRKESGDRNGGTLVARVLMARSRQLFVFEEFE